MYIIGNKIKDTKTVKYLILSYYLKFAEHKIENQIQNL